MVPFSPFYFGAPLLKPKSRKKGTLIIKRLLRPGAVVARVTSVVVAGFCCQLCRWVGLVGFPPNTRP